VSVIPHRLILTVAVADQGLQCRPGLPYDIDKSTERIKLGTTELVVVQNLVHPDSGRVVQLVWQGGQFFDAQGMVICPSRAIGDYPWVVAQHVEQFGRA